MYRMTKLLTTTLAAALMCVALAGCKKEGASGENLQAGVAATVNGKPIMLKEVDDNVNRLTEGQTSELLPLQLATARLQQLDLLIQREVLFQRAEKEKVVPTEEEITREINARKQAGRMTEEAYQNMLRENNQTEQAFREELKKLLAIQKLQEKLVGDIKISDKEVEEAYNKNAQMFVDRRGVQLSAIIVDPKENGQNVPGDAKNPAEAKLKIDGIHQQLKSGNADFATVALRQSEDPSAQQGGDLGVLTEEQIEEEIRRSGLPANLSKRLFGEMKVGDFTEPIQTASGPWVIFKLNARKLENRNQTLEEVRDQITEAIIGQRRQLLNAALVATSLNEAEVENMLASSLLKDPSMLGGMQPAAGAAQGQK